MVYKVGMMPVIACLIRFCNKACMSKKKTLVVIGNGMVGQYFFETFMDSTLKDNFEVVTFCEERIAAYDRIHLSEYFSGKTADDLSLVEEVFFRE